MLVDDRNLPHRAKIQLGDQILELLVSGTYDKDRNYIGPMLTWDIITEKVALAKALDDTAKELSTAADELSTTATQLSKNSEQTANQSVQAAANTEEVSKGVQTVATNTEEMVASIKEIARNSSEGANLSKDTLAKAQDTNKTITQLGASSQEIGNVIKVISSIAQQTNLLALNATIEAARAGDAGKGFAVVANEVKELAKQTAKATEDITNRIGAIQKDSQGAVDAIGGISSVIEKLNSISMAIAASIEQQTATTNEVARVVKVSNKGVDGIDEVVKSVSAAARQSSAGAAQTMEAAKSLAILADRLRKLVKSIEV
jgi:methyl-accepting chemotaxis protein